MDGYFFFYVLGIIFSIALVIWRNIEPINYILIICIATTIHINAVLYMQEREKR